MLKPNKHFDLEISVLHISSIVMSELLKQNILSYSKAVDIVVKRLGEDGRYNLMSAINLLFLLGKIEYHIKNDTLELITDY